MNRWTRRLSNYAACGLSAWDGRQTTANVGRFGIVESNPLFATNGGKSVRIPVLISVKAVMCVAPAIAGERLADSPARLFLEGTNIGSAGLYTWVTLHNRAVIGQAMRNAQSAGIAAE